jgi:DNA replication protein DnaC
MNHFEAKPGAGEMPQRGANTLSEGSRKWLKERLSTICRKNDKRFRFSKAPESFEGLIDMMKGFFKVGFNEKPPISGSTFRDWLIVKEPPVSVNPRLLEMLLDFIKDYSEEEEQSLTLLNKVSKTTKSLKATAFIDHFDSSSWGDLEATFDIPRDQYAQINQRLQDIHHGETSSGLLILKGPAGAGKTILLKRVLYDSCQGFETYLLNTHMLKILKNPKEIFLNELGVFLEGGKQTLLGIDELITSLDILELTLDDIYLKIKGSRVSLITTEQSDRIYTYLKKMYHSHDLVEEIYVNQLSHRECGFLVDKIIVLETSGKLNVKRYDLTREERLDLLVEGAERHLLVGLLQLRYGEQFETIIRREYDLIPEERGRLAYNLVSLFHTLGVEVYVENLVKALERGSSVDIYNAICMSTKEVLIENELGFFRTRHRIIAQQIVKERLPEASHRSNTLRMTLATIDFSDQFQQRFYEMFFEKRDIHRKVLSLLHKQADVAAAFFDKLTDKFRNAPVEQKYKLHEVHGLFFKLKPPKDLERSREIFEDLYYDQSYRHKLFVLTQLAWTEHELRNWDAAADYAEEALSYCKTPEQHLDVLQILVYSTYRNFRKAERYFKKLASEYPDDKECSEAYQNYMDVNNNFKYITNIDDDDLLRKEYINLLKPNIFIFKRLINNVNDKDFQKKLYGKLYHLQRTVDENDDELQDLIEDADIRHDKKLKGVLFCNQGRNLYLRMTKYFEKINPDDIERLFRDSMGLFDQNAYVYCWYGTFMKDIRGDFRQAKVYYERSVSMAEGRDYSSGFNNDGLHLFKNNLALLILKSVRMCLEKEDELWRAKDLLEDAINRVQGKDINFPWVFDNYEECLQEMRERNFPV